MKDTRDMKIGERFIHPNEPGIIYEVSRVWPKAMCLVVAREKGNSIREVGREYMLPQYDNLIPLAWINPVLDHGYAVRNAI